MARAIALPRSALRQWCCLDDDELVLAHLRLVRAAGFRSAWRRRQCGLAACPRAGTSPPIVITDPFFPAMDGLAPYLAILARLCVISCCLRCTTARGRAWRDLKPGPMTI